MIQIDDAGSGSLIGGTCIGVYRMETGEYFYDFIPLSLYSKENFPKKLYLDCTMSIAKKALEQLNAKIGEEIHVCPGYMFEKLKEWLSDNHYAWQSVKITGDFQDILERIFAEYTISLGLPAQYVNYTRYPFHFHKILRWVYADYHSRKRLCKVGWKSWAKYEGLKVEHTSEYLHSGNYFCLKCGRPLEIPGVVKVLRYVSNKPNIVYIHENCGE